MRNKLEAGTFVINDNDICDNNKSTDLTKTKKGGNYNEWLQL